MPRAADSQPVDPADPADVQPTTISPSAVSSPGSSAADPFIGDPGRFDPADPDADVDDDVGSLAPEPELNAAPLILWTPQRVRRVLTLQGIVTHQLAGVAENDWRWLDPELDMVCEPLADYANRVPALAAMAHLSDDAAVAAGFATYALRSWRDRVRELNARKQSQAGPVTGWVPEPAVNGATPVEPDPDQPEEQHTWSL